jgi:hypothetical protein
VDTDASGNVYIADWSNDRVQEFAPVAPVVTIVHYGPHLTIMPSLPIPAPTESQTTAAATETISAGTTDTPDTGSLSVTTTPDGAVIFLDGLLRGVSPATIHHLSPGTHTVLLKHPGYQDLTRSVTITAGQTQDYTSSMEKNTAEITTPATTESTTVPMTPKKTPGFEVTAALAAMGAILMLRKSS